MPSAAWQACSKCGAWTLKNREWLCLGSVRGSSPLFSTIETPFHQASQLIDTFGAIVSTLGLDGAVNFEELSMSKTWTYSTGPRLAWGKTCLDRVR